MSSGDDPLVRKLNHGSWIRFVPATDAVVEGADLRETGNRQLGRQVAVSTGPEPDLPDEALLLGRSIAEGHREALGACTLACDPSAEGLTISVFDTAGERIGRTLVARGLRGACDEGLFAWFGPVEDICTPWSDNDPPQCQVVTVDRLRAWAQAR